MGEKKRQRGSGITPARVVELLQEAVAETSILQVSKDTGLGLAAISRYLKGQGEPTSATLEKIASAYDVNIDWLRGSLWARREGGSLFDPLAYCAACGNELQASGEGFETNDAGEIVGDRRLRLWPCNTCCKKG